MIRLRDKRTGKEVTMTADECSAEGHLKAGTIELARPNTQRSKFSFDCETWKKGDIGDQLQDAHGDSIFVTAEGYEHVPERFLEPFVEGMSTSKFVRAEIVLHVYDDHMTSLVGILKHLKDGLAAAASGNCFLIAGDPYTEEVNATEMALAAAQVNRHPMELGLDSVGRPFKKPPENKPVHSDAMEALILALTAAGFPVHLPVFSEAVKSAIEGCANNCDEPTPEEVEEMERAVADAGYQINIDRMFDKWTINEWNADHWESVKGPNQYETRAEAVVAAYAMIQS